MHEKLIPIAILTSRCLLEANREKDTLSVVGARQTNISFFRFYQLKELMKGGNKVGELKRKQVQAEKKGVDLGEFQRDEH